MNERLLSAGLVIKPTSGQKMLVKISGPDIWIKIHDFYIMSAIFYQCYRHILALGEVRQAVGLLNGKIHRKKETLVPSNHALQQHRIVSSHVVLAATF